MSISPTDFAGAQTEAPPSEESAGESDEQKPPERIDIQPLAEDEEIGSRLKKILVATEWFVDPQVRVEEGVVFLTGEAKSPEHKEWATKLSGNTQDVVAVANRMKVTKPSTWDFTPAWQEIDNLRRNSIQTLPVLLVALVVLLLFWFATKFVAALSRRIAARRTSNSLLREVVAKAVSIPVLLLGIYLALRVSGLTRLAATVLGGTGLLGIVLGIAFRDIAENFLASILLSIQRPFRTGDLIIVEGRKGFVQSVTTRGTTIMTLDGNHVQIPNSTIYKSVIENITANPNQRQTFVVGVDYEDSLEDVQATILSVLKEHPTVLAKPEPLVLVDELAASTVNLRIYFWLDISKHDGLKVRSSLIRLVKKALVDGGFTLPDEAREVIFPKGIPIRMLEERETENRDRKVSPSTDERDQPERTTTQSEGSLTSEAEEIEQQAKNSRLPESGENLLAD
ncbi:mechanosensitive ion channel family protein [Bythopirellula goksoeyrii]|uniref:mechanosensitive ion channel family protein n=1 Tax=Bythopirellula goksoeyrii TaxID=1400387 RepID=UPI001AEF9EE9|nr:mechanosensitive ion channel family protein [Bythopirellula goksoeyrii]